MSENGGVPPQNDEAEVAVLGTILLTEQALDQIFVDLKLSAEDFYRPRHQLIFRAMLRLKEKAEPEAVDAITVCDDLKREGKLEEAGGAPYIHSLPTMVPCTRSTRGPLPRLYSTGQTEPSRRRIQRSKHALFRVYVALRERVQQCGFSRIGSSHDGDEA